MKLTTYNEPKCYLCVDYYRDECHCPKSVYCGRSMPDVPWEGCQCFLSQRKWDKPKKKRKPKWPTMAEFEFGV